MVAETFSSHAPELAQRIERGPHPLDRGGIGLRAAAPAQGVADLLERDIAANHRNQDARADLADRSGLCRLSDKQSSMGGYLLSGRCRALVTRSQP